MNEKVVELRNFISSNGGDAILINSSDEFLSEYNILPRNSRFKVTGFSGSMGDCIVTKNAVYQIADGRYHQQADNEVDSDVVTVIKMQQGSSPINEIVGALDENSTLMVTSNKVSADFCEKLSKKCEEKNIKIKYLSSDPIEDLSQNAFTNVELTRVSDKIASLSPEEKFKYFAEKLTDKQILLVTVPTDFAYLTNLRNYDFPYSSAPRAKAVVTKNSVTLFTDSKIPYEFEGLSVEPLEKFKNVLAQFVGKEILTDKSTISQADFMQIHPSNKVRSTNLFDVKSEKFDSEIEYLKSAFARTDRVLRKMNDLINSDAELSEYDLFCSINQFFKEEGALTQSFKPIIASGANSSIIHYSVASPDKIIKDGDLVMIDCGGFFEGGLATDITRTFVKVLRLMSKSTSTQGFSRVQLRHLHINLTIRQLGNRLICLSEGNLRTKRKTDICILIRRVTELEFLFTNFRRDARFKTNLHSLLRKITSFLLNLGFIKKALAA